MIRPMVRGEDAQRLVINGTMATGTRAFWEEMDGIWWDSGNGRELECRKMLKHM